MALLPKCGKGRWFALHKNLGGGYGLPIPGQRRNGSLTFSLATGEIHPYRSWVSWTIPSQTTFSATHKWDIVFAGPDVPNLRENLCLKSNPGFLILGADDPWCWQTHQSHPGLGISQASWPCPFHCILNGNSLDSNQEAELDQVKGTCLVLKHLYHNSLGGDKRPISPRLPLPHFPMKAGFSESTEWENRMV